MYHPYRRSTGGKCGTRFCLARAERAPEPEQSSSSAEEEDEGADGAEPEPLAALWMRGGRKSVAHLVGTAAAQLQPSAQLCGWLQLEGKKGVGC